MSDPQIERKVLEIIADQLGLSEEDVSPEATLRNDLGADSLDVVELLMALEEEFDLDIPDEVVERIDTVGDLINFLNRKTH